MINPACPELRKANHGPYTDWTWRQNRQQRRKSDHRPTTSSIPGHYRPTI